MPDTTDFEALRTAVHDACREANKGIFNNLEGVLLRLVDCLEAGNAADDDQIIRVDREHYQAMVTVVYAAREVRQSAIAMQTCGETGTPAWKNSLREGTHATVALYTALIRLDAPRTERRGQKRDG